MIDRNYFGRVVRDTWVQRYKQKHYFPYPDATQVAEWEDMTEYGRETDRLIAEAVMESADGNYSWRIFVLLCASVLNFISAVITGLFLLYIIK